MTAPKLPPLPRGDEMHYYTGEMVSYSDDAMRAYGLACYRAGAEQMRERAAGIVTETQKKFEEWIDADEAGGIQQEIVDAMKACASMALIDAQQIRALTLDGGDE